MKTESLDKTENKMIFIERDQPLTRQEVENKLDILRTAVEEAKNDIHSDKIKKAIIATVPTFCNPEDVNKRANKSDEMKMIS